MMIPQTVRSDLSAFAKRSIAAERFPGDHHIFTLISCDGCGVVPFKLTIKHHTGSREGNFRGKIVGLCLECDTNKLVFSLTGGNRKQEREEQPVCNCGQEGFFVGECERIEGDEGITGFFDEGVIVGKCSRCSQNRVFVHTD